MTWIEDYNMIVDGKRFVIVNERFVIFNDKKLVVAYDHIKRVLVLRHPDLMPAGALRERAG